MSGLESFLEVLIEADLKFDSDKFENGLMGDYLALLEPLNLKPIRMLEIGILKGESIRFWSQYFRHPEAQIVGLDISPPKVEFGRNVTIYQCDQNDGSRLREIADKHGPFDLIIDDGCHFRPETETCFRVLFERLSIGGYYVIEDWAVGYWKNAPHYANMVGLITDLIENTPELNIESFKIILAPGKAMAFFRRGERGWTG